MLGSAKDREDHGSTPLGYDRHTTPGPVRPPPAPPAPVAVPELRAPSKMVALRQSPEPEPEPERLELVAEEESPGRNGAAARPE